MTFHLHHFSMEAAIPKLEGMSEGIEKISNDINSEEFPFAKKQELVSNEMRIFQENLLEVSRACLNDISGFIDDIEAIKDEVNGIEGRIKNTKERIGNTIRLEGFDPPPCEENGEELTVETEEPNIQLPTGDYVLNFSALDQIGQTVECVANGEEGMPLVREIQPGEKMPKLWSVYEDYFVESKSSRSTFDPSRSTFVKAYGIEPSLYPDDPKLQRSVTQSEIDATE